MNADRLVISRLFHRFGFGPKPGEFALAIKAGIDATRTQLLSGSQSAAGATTIPEPLLTDLGQYPEEGTPARKIFNDEMRRQRRDLILWWLDRMALSENSYLEKMVWFWHGHWATSLEKVEYALPMYKQNLLMRSSAVGNFKPLARAMIEDGALQFWLDNGDNTIKAPNENFARELMELFILGVNNYSEDDVKAVARALTGYSIKKSSGAIFFNPQRHDSSTLRILGVQGSYFADQLTNLMVARTDCSRFIPERIWYRFISDSSPLPMDHTIEKSFLQRDIASTMSATATSGEFTDEANSLVRSPVEWFISICRALKITPSKVSRPDFILNSMDKLGQLPFAPPNVGGWPSGEAWLTAASAQYRLEMAQYLLTQGDISPLKDTAISQRYSFIGNFLGVARWSLRTERALRDVATDPKRMFLMAVSSPEYIVSA